MPNALNPRTVRATTAALALIAMSSGACRDSNGPLPEEATFTGRWAGRAWVGEAGATLADGGEAADTLFTSWGGPGGEVAGRISFVARSDSPHRSYSAVEFFQDGQFRATVHTYP